MLCGCVLFAIWREYGFRALACRSSSVSEGRRDLQAFSVERPRRGFRRPANRGRCALEERSPPGRAASRWRCLAFGVVHEDPVGHLVRPSPLWANALARTSPVGSMTAVCRVSVGRSMPTKISNCVIALLRCGKGQAAAFANSSAGAQGRGYAAGRRRARRSWRWSLSGIRRYRKS